MSTTLTVTVRNPCPSGQGGCQSPYKTDHHTLKVLGTGLIINLASYAVIFGILYSSYESPPRKIEYKVIRGMQALQTMVETYAVDYGGIYAPSLEALEKEAKQKGFWKDSIIPGTKGFYHQITPDRSMYLRSNEQSRPHSILYTPGGEDVFTHYRIIGYSGWGEPIKDQDNKNLTLSNL